MILRILSLLVLVCSAAPAAETASESWKIPLSAKSGEVEFLATGRPSALKIRGKIKDDAKDSLSGALKVAGRNVSGTAKLQLDALGTGIDLRDKHMKEKYLETGKFPTAEVQVEKLELPEACGKGDCSAEGVPFGGKLTLHGATQPVDGTVAAKRAGKDIDLAFDFKLKLSGHKIEAPAFLGITVTDDVAVTVKVHSPLEKP